MGYEVWGVMGGRLSIWKLGLWRGVSCKGVPCSIATETCFELVLISLSTVGGITLFRRPTNKSQTPRTVIQPASGFVRQNLR